MPWRLRAGIEAVRQLNRWRTHGSTVIAEQKARESLRERDRIDPDSVLGLLESQTLIRRQRGVEWATTWAAINDVYCIELRSLLESCEDADRPALTGILEFVSSRRRGFPLDASSEALAAAKRESILAT